MDEIVSRYQPDACVVQCGADAIAGDPLGGTNLIPDDLGKCVERILTWRLPTIFLGGGKFKAKVVFIKNQIFFINFSFQVVTILRMRHVIGLI